jgi:subtilisin family serine protease
VGNSNSSDARNSSSSSSSHGSCLDIFAPGTSIVSASYSNNNGSATMTGTSMASPHVAGAAALYLGANPNATPADVRNALVNNGTTGKITSPASGSPLLDLLQAHAPILDGQVQHGGERPCPHGVRQVPAELRTGLVHSCEHRSTLERPASAC